MRIRPYTQADCDAVAVVFTASVHGLTGGHYDAKQRAAWAPQPPDMNQWCKRLGAAQTLLAEKGDLPVGFISWLPNGHIELLYVLPGHVRGGVATALYRRAESRLVSTGVEALSAEVSSVARRFFERQGFRVVGRQSVRRFGVSLLRYRMRKTAPVNTK